MNECGITIIYGLNAQRYILLISTHSSQNHHFLKVFHSITIYRLLRLICWNLTTLCLAVTGVISTAEYASPAFGLTI